MKPGCSCKQAQLFIRSSEVIMLFKGPYNNLLINQNQNTVIIPKEINEETTADTTT